MSDETHKLVWLGGVTRISQEVRTEGNAIVAGFRINGGEFRKTSTLTFGGHPSALKPADPPTPEST